MSKSVEEELRRLSKLKKDAWNKKVDAMVKSKHPVVSKVGSLLKGGEETSSGS